MNNNKEVDIVKKSIANAYEFLHSVLPWKPLNSTNVHSRVLPYATLSPWLSDTDFLEIYEEIKDSTLVDIYRLYELWCISKQSADLEGDILEVGVWRGGSGAVLAKAIQNFPDKKVFLADTFRGVVKAGVRDTVYVNGEHADTSFQHVQKLISKLSLKNVQILEGVFPEDTGSQITSKISLIHIDVDVFDSCKDIVSWAFERLSKGSVIIFDDYGFQGCEGVKYFVDELRENKDFLFIHNLNGHAIFIKLS